MNQDTFCLVSKQTQRKIFDLIPHLQKQCEVIWKGEIQLNRKSCPRAIVVVSSHFIVLFKKSVLKNITLILSIHHFLLTGIEVINESAMIIRTKSENFRLNGNNILPVARTIYRNYMFSACFTTPNIPLDIISPDPTYLPNLTPSLSPSQMFQFCYYSNCSLHQVKYNHSIIQAIHTTLITSNPIIDFSIMPLSCFDNSRTHKISFTPLFSTMTFCPYFTGIMCYNLNKPNILKSFTRMLGKNGNISILALRNCGIIKGGKRLATAIYSNKNIGLQYIDLSGNQIADIDEFAKSLNYLTSKPFYLNLNGNTLNAEATSLLIRSINENPNLHNLTYLLANKATFTRENLSDFAHYINSLSEEDNKLTTLDLGRIEDGSKKLFKVLANKQVPIQCFKIQGSRFNTDSFNYFKIFISNAPNLKELDISNTNISITDIGMLINLIQANQSITQFKLHLNSMQLNGSTLETFVGFFNGHILNKWEGLGLENNGMKKKDLQLLLPLFQKMPNLSWINLSNNFASSMKGIDTELENLLSIPRLSVLELRGGNKKELNDNSFNKFFKALALRAKSIMLDIRFNNISDNCFTTIAELIINNKFQSISLDARKIKRISTIVAFYNAISQSTSLLNLDFNFDEKYKLLSTQTKKESKKNLDDIEIARYYANIALLVNRTNFGFHSLLSFDNIPQLDSLIDTSLVNLHQILQSARLFSHSSITEKFGLPYPFQKGTEQVDEGLENPFYKLILDDEIASIYGINQKMVTEENILNNIQYNSLCLRCPGAAMSFKIPKAVSDMFRSSLAELAKSAKSRGAIPSDPNQKGAHTSPGNVNANLNSFTPNIDGAEHAASAHCDFKPPDADTLQTLTSSTTSFSNSKRGYESWKSLFDNSKNDELPEESTESDTCSFVRVHSSSKNDSDSVIKGGNNEEEAFMESSKDNSSDIKEGIKLDIIRPDMVQQSESSSH